jgi:hypothetical protein
VPRGALEDKLGGVIYFRATGCAVDRATISFVTVEGFFFSVSNTSAGCRWWLRISIE